MSVAAFHAGIEALQVTGQCAVDGVLVIELGSGSQIVTHRFKSFSIFYFQDVFFGQEPRK